MTAYLAGNDHAEANDGGAPAGNSNAAKHYGFSDWRLVDKRLSGADLHHHARRVWWALRVARHARPQMAAAERRETARKWAALNALRWTALADLCPDGDGRGFGVEREVSVGDGEQVTVTKVNPALDAERRIRRERRELREELGLWDADETVAAPSCFAVSKYRP